MTVTDSGITQHIEVVMNCAVKALQNVAQTERIDKKDTSVVQSSILQTDLGVIIGVTGVLSGQIILRGKSSLFSNLAESLYGMPLEGEMLLSFTGEIGNMVGGQLSTMLFEKGVYIDISPPTIIEGNGYKIHGIKKGIQLDLEIDQGDLGILLALSDKNN
jgi:chemotaxis protein CheX